MGSMRSGAISLDCSVSCDASFFLSRKLAFINSFHRYSFTTSGSKLALYNRKNMLCFDTTQNSVGKSMKQEGVVLNDMNFFGYHDALNIYDGEYTLAKL